MSAASAVRVGGHGQRLYASTTDTYDEDRNIDFIAIERAMNGDRVELNLAERIEAARIMDGKGMSPTDISRLIRADPSSVTRWKARGWTLPQKIPANPKVPKGPGPRPDECGTAWMYRRHLSRGDAPCNTCREAAAVERRKDRQRRRDAGLKAR